MNIHRRERRDRGEIKMTEEEEINLVTEKIIGAAINVHRAIGPGLLESANEACLAYELTERGLKVEQ
jgi:hypothetical protein